MKRTAKHVCLCVCVYVDANWKTGTDKYFAPRNERPSKRFWISWYNHCSVKPDLAHVLTNTKTKCGLMLQNPAASPHRHTRQCSAMPACWGEIHSSGVFHFWGCTFLLLNLRFISKCFLCSAPAIDCSCPGISTICGEIGGNIVPQEACSTFQLLHLYSQQTRYAGKMAETRLCPPWARLIHAALAHFKKIVIDYQSVQCPSCESPCSHRRLWN